MVWTVHLPRTTFSHAQLLRKLVFYWCQSVQSQIDPMHLHDQVTKHIVCGSSKNTHTSSRNVVHLATLDDTTHGHSFLTFSWTSLAASRTTLRRSTTTAEWRFGRAPTRYRLWVQAACWRPGLQALHRRRSLHWTQGFTCQFRFLPKVDHGVNLWLNGKHRDTVIRIGFRRRTTSCSAGFTTVLTGATSKCRTIASLSLWTKKLDVQFSQDPISTGKPVELFSSQNRLNQEKIL